MTFSKVGRDVIDATRNFTLECSEPGSDGVFGFTIESPDGHVGFLATTSRVPDSVGFRRLTWTVMAGAGPYRLGREIANEDVKKIIAEALRAFSAGQPFYADDGVDVIFTGEGI